MRRLALILVSCLAGCVPQVDVPEWDQVDVESVIAALAAPTATVADVDATDVDRIDETGRRAAVLATIDAALDEIGPYLEDMGDAEPKDGGGEASGTSVYLKLSCPGPDPLDPVTDFSQGTLRLDSARITRALIENAGIQGDVLLTFTDCRVGASSIDGLCPAFYDRRPTTARLVIDPDASVSNLLGGVDTPLDSPAVFETNSVDFELAVEGEKTLTVHFDLGNPAEYEMRLADGTFDCSALTQECVPQ